MPILLDPTAKVRQCVFSEHNWHDYESHGRSVRCDGFLYLRNNRPQFAWQGPADSVASPSFQQLRRLRDSGALTAEQADVFLAPRPVEELYRTDSDPSQMHNLANDPEFRSTKIKLANLLDDWIEATHDSVPARLTQDQFDRETGVSLLTKEERKLAPRGTPAGSDRNASHTNASGPR